MMRIRATIRSDPDEAPRFFNLLAHSDDIAEAHIMDVNTAFEGVETFLLAIDGNPKTFTNQARELPGVESVEISKAGENRAYALLVVRPLETEVFGSIHRMGPHAGFVIRMPIIYRDGKMYAHAVGTPEALQRAHDNAPNSMDVQIDEISQFQGETDDPEVTLSQRQQEALEAAYELGYYNYPRESTHEDVADELECAPVTASDHLQKAEAKFVKVILDEFGPSI